MAKRVTDLEEFSLTQIWRPYQTLLGYEDRLTSPPVSLSETASMLSKDSEWSRCVLGRVRGIGFTFPAYINHPLVDVVRNACTKESPTHD